MNNPLIGVIVSSSCQGGRFGEVPAHWIYRMAEQRSDLRIELIDLGGYPLPFFGASALAASCPDESPVGRCWAAALDRLDGFIVVASEEGPKRGAGAITDAGRVHADFAGKPVAFVGYGKPAGASGVDPLRSMALALRMAPVTQAVHLGKREVVGIWQQGKTFEDFPHLDSTGAAMLDELVRAAQALKTTRDGVTVAAATVPSDLKARAGAPAGILFVRELAHRIRLAALRVGASAMGTMALLASRLA